ncbi:hypothetical protein EYC98_10010 [Halieaceae bacterium IMCC14734]|uniref:Guanylate cyclase domain-containing protein n=1 Tax=Candidatus Litorirhabdus singularis TaxID=2518993 RepID=A0ABT3TG64_9GAMM|nr:adenylate/guanylate cyclase domain-containing protein [Candidatus Litorirhabdus singularis]MCX2981195.1 hypothetical protein [Candidatus Litorirhabdus singularis]
MMWQIFVDSLATNEPFINAVVGLLSLTALAWGLLKLIYSSPVAPVRADGEVGRSPSVQWFQNLLAPVLNLGIEHYVQVEDRIAARTVNIGAVAVMFISISMTVFGFSNSALFPFVFAHLPAFLMCLLTLYLQAKGKLQIARWIFLGLIMLDWISSHIVVGPWRGNEYVMPAILMLPVVVFKASEIRQRNIALILICTLALTTVLLRHFLDIAPLDIPEGFHVVGYHMVLIVVTISVFLVVNYYVNFSVASFSELELEKLRTDELVQSIFPDSVMKRMTEKETSFAHFHEEATVVFITVTGFRDLYQRISAVQLVELLSNIFIRFDELLVKHGVEKINTLGTHYVAATGVFDGNKPDHAALARFTLDALEAVEDFGEKMHHPFTLKAGMSTGQVISGVIGSARPCFDIWGRTVELANSMQDTALDNTIAVNEAAYWRLREEFDFAEIPGDVDGHLLLKPSIPDTGTI